MRFLDSLGIPIIRTTDINSSQTVREIEQLEPDVLLSVFATLKALRHWKPAKWALAAGLLISVIITLFFLFSNLLLNLGYPVIEILRPEYDYWASEPVQNKWTLTA